MLVIFDCDGVLVDSEPIANALLARYLSDLGLPMTREESVEAFMGRSWAAGVELIEERLGHAVPDDFDERYHAELQAAFERDLRAVRGIEAALDAIDEPRCVASSGTHERIRSSLRLTGLLDRFPDETIFSAEDVEHGKPAPDLFLHAAASMGFEPGDCVVVEDSPAGIEGALAAGMRVLGYGVAVDGAETFASMDELPALLSGSAPRSAAAP
jgi:HAD superfamily hydrolase (TIGR01509 family)